MKTFHNSIKKDFTIIPNVVSRDSNLSWKAKGVFMYLASRPEDWNFYVKEIIKNAADGKQSTQTALKELLKFGYLKRENITNSDGTIAGKLWTVQIPSEAVEVLLRPTGKPSNGETVQRESTSHTNTNSTNTDNTNTNDIAPRSSDEEGESELKRTKKPDSKLSAKERTEKFMPFANYLAKIVSSQKDIHHPKSQLKGWAADIRKLSEMNKVPPKRIKAALKWYSKNAGRKYVPVIESGSSLRSKFVKLENAIKRDSTQTESERPKTGHYEEDYQYQNVNGTI
jgi:hypothetical protein